MLSIDCGPNNYIPEFLLPFFTIRDGLLNQHLVFGSYSEINGLFILLGYLFDQSFAEQFDATDIPVDEFIVSCGNEIRLKIIDMIAKQYA